MKQLNALLKKELKTNRGIFWLPVWVSAAFYALVLISIAIALIQGADVSFFNELKNQQPGANNFGLYMAVLVATMVIGLVSLISVIGLADNVLNGDFKHRCEILHFSQPASFGKIAFSKYLFTTLGAILLLGAVTLFNGLVISGLFGVLFQAQIQFGLVAWLQTWIVVSLQLIVVASVVWLFAALFKQRSAQVMMLTFLVIEVSINLLNRAYGWQIPSPLRFLLGGTLHINQSTMAAQDLAASGKDAMSLIISQMDNLISGLWQAIFNLKMLLKLAVSAVLTLGGVFIYKRRELV